MISDYVPKSGVQRCDTHMRGFAVCGPSIATTHVNAGVGSIRRDCR